MIEPSAVWALWVYLIDVIVAAWHRGTDTADRAKNWHACVCIRSSHELGHHRIGRSAIAARAPQLESRHGR